MKTQVKKEHYNFDKYVDEARWMSYYYQVKEALASGSKSFLIIGKGDGIVPAIIQELVGLNGVVDTFDYDEQLQPTYIGDIRELSNVVTKKYDCILCCQVLEHLEYKYFESIIKEIDNICNSRVILSLP
ncbi:MAG: hypothetical protein NC086_03670, partial [Alistipes sp.]|nr:hypothetical protein [Alistipes sp.]